MTNAQKADRAEAIEQLQAWIKPGDTVYTILDHVSASGMSRAIRVILPTINHRDRTESEGADSMRERDSLSVDFLHPNYAVGKALGLRHWKRNGREQDALVVGGCGMDMGFHLVYELSSVLYGGRLVPDIYLDSATHDQPGGRLLTRTDAPAGHVYLGGYACLGKGRCPSNYHVNHHNRIRCEGTRIYNPDGPDSGDRCWRPSRWHDQQTPAGWPSKTVDLGEGASVQVPVFAIGEAEAGPWEVCPTCHGEGEIDNPEGPERFDLVHTDGYALRHRWL